MNNKLSIQDLASAFAEKVDMDAKSANIFVKTVFEIVEEYIATDKIVKIKGFGTFKLISVSDRESVNVNTGERIIIAGHTKLSFTPDAALKDAVNRPFADFETTPLNDSTSIEDMERIPTQEKQITCEDFMSEDDNESASPIEDACHQDAEVVETVQSEEIIETLNDKVSTESSGQAGRNTNQESLESPDAEVIDDAVSDAEETVDEKETDITDRLITAEETSVGTNVRESVVVSHIEENSSYPMASEIMLSADSERKSSVSTWFYVLLTILLMALSYVAGHYQLLSNFTVAHYSDSYLDEIDVMESEEILQTPVLADSLLSDSINQDTLVTDTVVVSSELPVQNTTLADKESLEEIAKYFPQVPGGEYWIVGDAGRVHYMEVGETLYRIARKELGSQKLVQYLIVFNDFEDPNIIHTGDPIRIPKIVKKDGSEITDANR
jgi:nucleoid DNA-binding protein